MDKQLGQDIEREREELLKLLDRSTAREVKESLQIALSMLPKPAQWKTRVSKEGTFDAKSKQDL